MRHSSQRSCATCATFLADPHPGNIAVDAEGEGRLIYYDFGMMGTIPGDVREGLLELFYGVYQKDPDRCGPVPPQLVLTMSQWGCSGSRSCSGFARLLRC